MKMKIYIMICACALVLGACNKNKSTDSAEMAESENEDKFKKPEAADTEFAVAAADGGMLEVALGELAQKNAQSPAVIEFAKQMVNDHGRGNAQLKALVEQKGISIPTVLSDKSQEQVDDLALKKGAEFDKAYADLMVKDHKKDVDLFRKESESGNDAELKAWAGETLPTLEHHLEMAEGNAKSLN